MPPERDASATFAEEPSLLLDAADEPHPGCNCGRRRKLPTIAPLLTDDLVIASRARAREPELPEATVAHALATPISARPARYDVDRAARRFIGYPD